MIQRPSLVERSSERSSRIGGLCLPRFAFPCRTITMLNYIRCKRWSQLNVHTESLAEISGWNQFPTLKSPPISIHPCVTESTRIRCDGGRIHGGRDLHWGQRWIPPAEIHGPVNGEYRRSMDATLPWYNIAAIPCIGKRSHRVATVYNTDLALTDRPVPFAPEPCCFWFLLPRVILPSRDHGRWARQISGWVGRWIRS